MFAKITKLQDALAAIAGHSEFEIIDQNGFIFLYYNHIIANVKEKPNSKEEEEFRRIRLECRGIIFDKATGNLVSRKFHKFYNINGAKHAIYFSLTLFFQKDQKQN